MATSLMTTDGKNVKQNIDKLKLAICNATTQLFILGIQMALIFKKLQMLSTLTE